MKLPAFLRSSASGQLSTASLARDTIRRADFARDAGEHCLAAFLYCEALRLVPRRADLHVMAGHMRKDVGDFAAAERHYRAALEQMPNDADLAVQFGHLYKNAGRLAEATEAYQRAARLNPGWDVPKRELANLERASRGLKPEVVTAQGGAPRVPLGLTARPVSELLKFHPQGVELKRLGRRERTDWGIFPVLRGVEAIRGYCISAEPIVAIELHLNEELIYRGPLRGGYPVPLERDPLLRRYVFNIWIDMAGFAPGRHRLDARMLRAAGQAIVRRDEIVVARQVEQPLLPESDSQVEQRDSADPRSLVEQIDARPSRVREAGQPFLRQAARCVLVQRVDQLGDLVVSVPALRKLRALFANAQLVGLVSRANADLARTLELFDDIVTVDFSAATHEPRRVLTAAAHDDLVAQLDAFSFDLAIDLSEAESSRLLLPLSKAPILVGYRSGQFPNLDIDISANTYDKANDHEVIPHAKKALVLVEWLKTALAVEPNLAVRTDLDRARLERFGLPADARFAILHAGARAKFSRWPHYLELARLIIERTDLHVVMMTVERDEPVLHEVLSGSGRFQLMRQQLDFDDFDALLGFSTIFVGDDSGPKHLAALRGANVISVQTARNNWMEWGQTTGGSVVTRAVPCAGCLIQNDVEAQECGRDIVCLTAIRPEEVFAVIASQIAEAHR